MSESRKTRDRIIAVAFVAIVVLFLIDLTTFGLSAKYTSDARDSGDASLIGRAIGLRPTSSEAYFHRAVIEEENGELEAAASSFEKSAELGPHDYYTWLRLGVVRLKLEKKESAAEAFARSVALAENYAAPNWFHGSMLRDAGREEESWKYLRRAYLTDSSFLPPALNLAWLDARGDIAKMDEILKLNRDSEKMILGWFLYEKGAIFDARSYLCKTDQFAPEKRSALVEALAHRGQFRLAVVAESADCADTVKSWNREGVLVNGGFEEDLAFRSGLFGWRLESRDKKIAISVDPASRTEGNRSLRIDFREAEPKNPPVTQLIAVEPGTRYRLTLNARVLDWKAGIFPIFSVLQAGEGKKSLVRSEPLGAEWVDWSPLELEFATPEGSEAVFISLGLESCKFKRCPVIGTVWLDGFNLEKLNNQIGEK
jgi:Tfp pilus assembly protein PilF